MLLRSLITRRVNVCKTSSESVSHFRQKSSRCSSYPGCSHHFLAPIAAGVNGAPDTQFNTSGQSRRYSRALLRVSRVLDESIYLLQCFSKNSRSGE